MDGDGTALLFHELQVPFRFPMHGAEDDDDDAEDNFLAMRFVRFCATFDRDSPADGPDPGFVLRPERREDEPDK